MREHEPSAATARHRGGFAALSVGKLNVLIGREQLRTIEAATDIDVDAPPPGGVGWFTLDRDRFPIYCTGGDLRLITAIPAARRICVVLRREAGLFGVLCDEVVLVAADTIHVHDLPVAMHLPNTPIAGLAKYADAIACVSTADRLCNNLSRAASGTVGSRPTGPATLSGKELE